MSNDFFTKSGAPSPSASGSSTLVRAEFAAIEAAFNKLPALTGNANKLVVVNPGETALTATGALSGLSITGGSINNTPIGASTPSTINATTVNATIGITGSLTGNVAGNVVGNVTSSGSSAFQNVTINGTLDMNAGTSSTITGLAEPVGTTDAATKNYVDTSINNLIAGAPGLLNTLDEIALALGDDPNFAGTMTTQLAAKLDKSGGTMSGNIVMGGNKITNLGTPTAGTDAVNKTYIDTLYGSTAAAAASATAAATSEANALTYSNNASTQATNALNSANAAAASYDSFDDRYLGVKAAIQRWTTMAMHCWKVPCTGTRHPSKCGPTTVPLGGDV